MKTKKLLVIILTTLFFSLLLLFIIESRTHSFGKLWDKYILDNRNHYLSCEKLPDVKYINWEVEQNRDVLEDIIIEVGKNYNEEEVTPYWIDNSVQDAEGFNISISWGELSPRCENTGKGDILFTYISSRDREVIEKYIHDDTFLGIPYRMRNV